MPVAKLKHRFLIFTKPVSFNSLKHRSDITEIQGASPCTGPNMYVKVLRIVDMSNTDFYNQLLEQEKSLVSKIEEYQGLLSSVRDLLKHYNQSKELKTLATKSKLDEAYDKDWTIKDKVHYALKSIVKGTADEVAERLSELDDSFDSEKASRVSTHHLSGLYRDKFIDAIKVGKKYRYYAK